MVAVLLFNCSLLGHESAKFAFSTSRCWLASAARPSSCVSPLWRRFLARRSSQNILRERDDNKKKCRERQHLLFQCHTTACCIPVASLVFGTEKLNSTQHCFSLSKSHHDQLLELFLFLFTLLLDAEWKDPERGHVRGNTALL